MIYSVLSAICMGLISLVVIFFIASFIKAKCKGETIKFLRGFKKGKCMVIYLIAIPLFTMGLIYGGTEPLLSFFSSLNSALSLVILKLDTKSIALLMQDNAVFKWAIYYCFIVVIINAMLFTISLMCEKFAKWMDCKKWNHSKGKKIVLVGNNPENIQIYKSCKSEKPAIVDALSTDASTALFAKKITHFSSSKADEFCAEAIDQAIKSSNELVIIVNTHDDEKNISLCRKLSEKFSNNANVKKAYESSDENRSEYVELLSKLKIYVFGSPLCEALYDEVVESSKGCVHYINKHRQVAIDFIQKYPLSLFMNETHLDYEKATVRDGVDINVSMIGFGKIAQQIFMTSIANNQFITEKDSEIILKQVNYHIFDKELSENNKNLTHSYYRYKNEFADIDQSKYLPLPELPANDMYYHLDVNSSEFYNDLKKVTTGNPKAVNFIVIAFGTDLENIDMAKKLLAKKDEWGVENLTVFTKVYGKNNGFEIFSRSDCFAIGNEKEVIFNIEKICNNSLEAMAIMRNRVYALEYELKCKKGTLSNEEIDKIFTDADYAWYCERTQAERESNIYCCLSLRQKLNLIGLDCAREGNFLTEKEYMEKYAKGNMPEYYDNLLADGKKIVRPTLDFPPSLRTSLAIQEHYRWNSYMLSKGTVPSSIEQILTEKKQNGKYSNGRSYALRRHGNLTTFDGLVEFRRLTAKRDNATELEKDVICYDFQLMDDAHWLLTRNGLGIC